MPSDFGTLPTHDLKEKATFTGVVPVGNTGASASGHYVIERWCKFVDKAANLPTMFSAYPGDATFLLTEILSEREGALCKITLTYTLDITSISISTLPTPPTTYVEQTSTETVPISQHPSFGAWSTGFDYNLGVFTSGPKIGVSTYVVGTTSVVVTVYSVTKPSTALSGLCKISVPGGDFTEAGHWLLMGATRSKQGGFYVMVKTYQYSAKVWDSDIYS